MAQRLTVPLHDYCLIYYEDGNVLFGVGINNR